jgi:hypothetical protein
MCPAKTAASAGLLTLFLGKTGWLRGLPVLPEI